MNMLLLWLPLLLLARASWAYQAPAAPTPPTWPEQFHAQYISIRGDRLSLVDLWYDWPNGRNLNLVTSQLSLRGVLHDVEYDNHTSFYYDLGRKTCRRVLFDVGILRPDWLTGATYNGIEVVDNVTTWSFTQADGFVTYWCEVDAPHRPVRWRFFDNARSEIMSWVEGAVLEDSAWQAPPYCFNTSSTTTTTTTQEHITTGRAGSAVSGSQLVLGRAAAAGGAGALATGSRGGLERRLGVEDQQEEEGQQSLGWYWRELASRLNVPKQ